MKTKALLAVLAVALGGCASPARVDQMTVQSSVVTEQAFDQRLRNNVAVVDVTGGKETNPMWVSNVSSPEFSAALEASLKSAGLLSGGKQLGNYKLTAHLQKLDQPMLGLDMTVTAVVDYSLVDRESNKEVFARTVSTPFTATFGHAALGVERLRIANEGAVKTNIQRLLDELASLRPAK